MKSIIFAILGCVAFVLGVWLVVQGAVNWVDSQVAIGVILLVFSHFWMWFMAPKAKV